MILIFILQQEYESYIINSMCRIKNLTLYKCSFCVTGTARQMKVGGMGREILSQHVFDILLERKTQRLGFDSSEFFDVHGYGTYNGGNKIRPMSPCILRLRRPSRNCSDPERLCRRRTCTCASRNRCLRSALARCCI